VFKPNASQDKVYGDAAKSIVSGDINTEKYIIVFYVTLELNIQISKIIIFY